MAHYLIISYLPIAGLFILPAGEAPSPVERLRPTQQQQLDGWLNSLAGTALEQQDESERLDPISAPEVDSEDEEDLEPDEDNLPSHETPSSLLDARSLLAVDIGIDIWAIRCRVSQVHLSSL